MAKNPSLAPRVGWRSALRVRFLAGPHLTAGKRTPRRAPPMLYGDTSILTIPASASKHGRNDMYNAANGGRLAAAACAVAFRLLTSAQRSHSHTALPYPSFFFLFGGGGTAWQAAGQ